MWSTKTSRSKRKRFKQKRASPLRKAPKRQCPVPPPGENKRAKTPKPVASPKLIKLSKNGSQSQSHTWPLQSHGHAQGEVSQHTSHSIDRDTDVDIAPHTAAAVSPGASLSCTPPPSMSLSTHSHSPPIWPSPSASIVAMGTRSRPSSSHSLSAYQSLSPPPGSVSSATFPTPRMLSSTSSLPMSMPLPTGDGNAGNAVSAVNMEIGSDKSDERDEDVGMALKREMVSYEQALSDVTSRFEQLTRDNEMVASSGANSAEHSLSMQRNKELLCFGFIREHTRLTVSADTESSECDPDLDIGDFEEDGLGVGERMSVPRDIMRFIFQHYDNTMVWDVRGAHFEAFTRKETLKGPCFAIENVLRLNANNANTKSNSANTNANANNADAKENVNDHSKGESEDIAMSAAEMAMEIDEETSLCLELELSHKEHADFVSCYLVSSRVPKGVQSMLISFTLFLRELQYECRSTMCYEDEDDAKGWNALAVPFGELRGLESLHIECSVDILDIRFTPTAAECVNARAVERVMSAVPPMRDCLFLWHITRAQMSLFRGGSAKRYRYHYSDNFNNNCFVLGCDPHFNLEEFPDEEPKVLLALNMLRAPQEVQAVTLKVEFAAFADHRCFRHHQTTTLQLDAYETSCDELLFSSAMLQQLTALSFMVELKVIEIKYKEY